MIFSKKNLHLKIQMGFDIPAVDNFIYLLILSIFLVQPKCNVNFYFLIFFFLFIQDMNQKTHIQVYLNFMIMNQI